MGNGIFNYDENRTICLFAKNSSAHLKGIIDFVECLNIYKIEH